MAKGEKMHLGEKGKSFAPHSFCVLGLSRVLLHTVF